MKRRGRGNQRRRQLIRESGRPQEWVDDYLRDFGAFTMVIARHFKRKVWRVDKAFAATLCDDWQDR